jgi:hypothetical protein
MTHFIVAMYCCVDTLDTSRASSEEAFGLAELDGFVVLKPISSFRVSRNTQRR